MSVIVIDTLSRGGSGTSEFPVIKESDSELSYVTVTTLAARDTIPAWKRLPFMRCHVIEDGNDYRLGNDVTIPGQVWTNIDDGWGSEQYQLSSEKGQPDGYVPLNADSKINPVYIQNIYSNNSYVVTNLTEMYALAALTGDIVIITDTSQTFVKLDDTPPITTSADYAELQTSGSVLSVNGMTGAVEITIDNLLAHGTNQSQFNVAVAAAPQVSGNTSAIAANTSNINTLLTQKSPGIAGSYATLSTMIADQSNQYINHIYRIDDTIDQVNKIVGGLAYYEYLGTTNGDITDYNLISAEHFNHYTIADGYLTESAMTADQAHQTQQNIYRVFKDDNKYDYYEYTGATNSNITDYFLIGNGSSNGGSSTIENHYSTTTNMISDQLNQTSGTLHYVADASDVGINGPTYYEYLGTINGDITDYQEITNLKPYSILYVDSGYSGGSACDGSAQRPFTTFAQALSASTSNGIIYAKGLNLGQPTLNKELTIIGFGKDITSFGNVISTFNINIHNCTVGNITATGKIVTINNIAAGAITSEQLIGHNSSYDSAVLSGDGAQYEDYNCNVGSSGVSINSDNGGTGDVKIVDSWTSSSITITGSTTFTLDLVNSHLNGGVDCSGSSSSSHILYQRNSVITGTVDLNGGTHTIQNQISDDNFLEPNTWYVNVNNGDDTTGNGSAQLPFKTIQHAHDSAADRDIIILQSSGTVSSILYGNLAATKTVTIEAMQIGEKIGDISTTGSIHIILKNLIANSVGNNSLLTLILIESEISSAISQLHTLYIYGGLNSYGTIQLNNATVDLMYIKNSAYCAIIGNDLIVTDSFVISDSKIGSGGINHTGSSLCTLTNSIVQGNIVVNDDFVQSNSVIVGTVSVAGNYTLQNQVNSGVDLNQPNTWYINGNVGNDVNGDGSAQEPFKTIQKAHDLASADDIIILQPSSTAYGNLNATKSITIKSLEFKTNIGNVTTTGVITLTFQNLYINTIQDSSDLDVYLIDSLVSVSIAGLKNLVIYGGQPGDTIYFDNCALESLIIRGPVICNINVGDLNILSYFKIIGAVIRYAGINHTGNMPCELINSVVQGNVSVTDDLLQANSVITGTTTVTGTHTIQNQASGGTSLPPVDASYADTAAMIVGQGNQTAQYIYNAGIEYYEYLGTTVGDITDYRLVGSGSTPDAVDVVVDDTNFTESLVGTTNVQAALEILDNTLLFSRQSITITNANATAPLTLNSATTVLEITLDAALTQDWAPASISGASVGRTYLLEIIKNSDNGIDLSTARSALTCGFDDDIDWTTALVDIEVNQRAVINFVGFKTNYIQFGSLILTDSNYVEV